MSLGRELTVFINRLRTLANATPPGAWQIVPSAGYNNVSIRVGGKPLFSSGNARRPRSEIVAAAAYVVGISPDTLCAFLNVLEGELATQETQHLSETARLRAALAYYTTATYVSSWGNQELADDGELARRVLAQPANNADPRLATATQTLLAALGVAQEKAQEQQAAWDASSGEDGDFAAYLEASERYKTAEAEVDQARATIAHLLLGEGSNS